MSSTTPYSSVKSRKVSELISRQIKESILKGIIKPKDRLPPVRKLVEHFEASPASVREALKTLEASGLLAVKPGSGFNFMVREALKEEGE